MKFFVIFLAVFAFSSVQADSEEIVTNPDCSIKSAETCIHNLLSNVVDDSPDEEMCRELRSSIDCLIDVQWICDDTEDDDAMEKGLEQLKKLLKENCNSYNGMEATSNDEEMVEIRKCYYENEDYIMECTTDQNHLDIMDGKDKRAVAIKCAMHGMMASCVVGRFRKKCGKESINKVLGVTDEELSYSLQHFYDLCSALDGEVNVDFVEILGATGDTRVRDTADGEIDVHELLDDKRRK